MTSPTSEPFVAPVTAQLVWLSGTDAARFLDDLISQRVGDMAEGETRRSFLLTPQGKLAYLFWVIRDGERFGLFTEDGRAEQLAAALGRYRIRVNVDIEPEPQPVWVVVGPWNGPEVSWADAERHVVIGERPHLAEGSVDRYLELRVRSGEPAWGVDVDENTIPHESGLVTVSVDFDKGCYLGQELVARIDSRGGNTPRRLRLLETRGGRLSPGLELVMEGKTVGMVTSATGPVGLGMVRREVAVGDTVRADGFEVTVRDLPDR